MRFFGGICRESGVRFHSKYVQYDDGEEAYNNACVRVGLCFELVGFSNSDSAIIGGKKAFAFSWGDLSYTGVNEDPYFVYNMFNEANKNHALAKHGKQHMRTLRQS